LQERTLRYISGAVDFFLRRGSGLSISGGAGREGEKAGDGVPGEEKGGFGINRDPGSDPENNPGTSTQISSIRAPIGHSGGSFGMKSRKCSTFVLGIPRFSVRSAIGGIFEAENHR